MTFYYLKKLINYVIIYGNNRKNFFIKSFLNFHWVGDKESEKSMLGFIFMLNKGFVI